MAFTTKDVTTETEHGMRLIVRCQKKDPLGLGHVCLIPNIAALAKCSPLTIFKRWLVLRADLVKESKSESLFVNSTGINKGHQVSCDTLRKHVASAFGSTKANHSLRKGGAVYFARYGAPSDATRQQGGWRTTLVMSTIYTKLNRKEVDAALSRVADASSLQIAIRRDWKALGSSSAEVLALTAARLRPFLSFIAEHAATLDEHTIQESRVIPMLKVLSQHPEESTRNFAINLHTTLRSTWMSFQAAKRQRTSTEVAQLLSWDFSYERCARCSCKKLSAALRLCVLLKQCYSNT